MTMTGIPARSAMYSLKWFTPSKALLMSSEATKTELITARRNARIASAVLATAIPSVYPSVRPSHAGIVSKRRHVARCSMHVR